jgi:hypothetical protein
LSYRLPTPPGTLAPVSLIFEYSHTWWQDANFSSPAASPAFGDNFKRSDDVLKAGITVSLGH